MPRPIANPPNPWQSVHVEWLDEEPPPDARLELFEEEAGSILAENDSPDVGFRWSVNPYRGCFHACAYCLDGDTPVLMGDGTSRRIADLHPGDLIVGTASQGAYRRFVRTRVLAHWSTEKAAHRLLLRDGTELVASGDHRFLTDRGWKSVGAPEHRGADRPRLGTHDRLMGVPEGMPLAQRRSAYDGGRHAAGGVGLAACARIAPAPSSIEGCGVTGRPGLDVVSIEALGERRTMFDVTTGTGDFVANGVVSHNCYARPSHQYLGFGAGTDFERKIVVKTNAPELLRAAFLRPSWQGERIAFSGNTDCYQPLEAHYRLTRRCLETCLEFKNSISVITKGTLVRRDVDVLAALAKEARVTVSFSIPFAKADVARKIEPSVGPPARRFESMRILSDAGIPTCLALAPVIPGLNDVDVPELLARARDAGAKSAFLVMLRLANEVKPVFRERLAEAFPDRAEKIWSQIRDVRGGRDYVSEFGKRQRGEGPRWAVIQDLFDKQCARLGLNEREDGDDEPTTFRRPSEPTLFPL